MQAAQKAHYVGEPFVLAVNVGLTGSSSTTTVQSRIWVSNLPAQVLFRKHQARTS
jgi:hypothetical protein